MISVSTAAYNDRRSWLIGRRAGIGASDAAAILGLSRYHSPVDIWAEKTMKTDIADDGNEPEYMEWGHLLEPVIADKYRSVTGRDLHDLGDYTLAWSPDTPWLLCTPDRLILSAPPEQVGMVLEVPDDTGELSIKTGGFFKLKEWQDEPPLEYQIQLQHTLLSLGLPWGSFAVLLGGQQFYWQDAPRNDSFCALLLEAEEQFWDYVQRDELPPVDGHKATSEALKRIFPDEVKGSVVELPSEAGEWDRRLQGIRAASRRLEKAAVLYENQIKASIGDAEAGLLADGTRYSYTTTERAGYTVQPKRFRALRRLKARR